MKGSDLTMKTSELMDQIESRIKELATRTEEAKASEEVTQYLQFISKFHRYSLHNSMSIWMHCPHATQVAGYKAWQKLGRNVKKGEKGIPIFAPCTHVVTEVDEEDERKVRRVIGFKIVYVFDVSQTEGELLPEAPITARGQADGLVPILESIARSHGITYGYQTMDGSHHGTSYGGHIEIDARLDDAGRASVWVHELAHELLHKGDDRQMLSRLQRETEAEATAYVVCTHFGIDSAAPNYLALWRAEPEEIMGAFQRIRNVASTLIEAIEAEIPSYREEVPA
ncbi:MAG: DUF1738 domain-containing protein [Firmicutes bacterium]|nr:DUF1738 domain-containing protein [Bacillota bacterium]